MSNNNTEIIIKNSHNMVSKPTVMDNSSSSQELFEEKIEGKWVSINIDPNTYYWLHEIKKALAHLNIRVSRNDIMKRLLLLGTDNLPFDVIMKNPLILWTKEAEEELV